MRKVIDDLIDRLGRIALPRNRPSRASVRKVISDVADRVSKIAPLRSLRSQTTLGNVIAELANRLEALRWRLRTSRLGRSADGIIVLPLLGIVLVLGIFTATAATNRSSATDSDLRAAVESDDERGEVVTQTRLVTVTTPGKKKLVTVERTRVQRRIVKRPGGVSTVFESVAPGPSQTKTVTKTVTGPTKTVTQFVTETVTTVLTVTETVKGKP